MLAATSEGAVVATSGPVKLAISQFGKIVPLPNAAMQPDPELNYRVAFSITKAAARPDRVNPSLEKVARYLNLLTAGGVRPAKMNIVAIIHGPATELVLRDDAFRRKYGSSNPNSALIDALVKAGVEIHVCGQALAGQKIAPEDVSSLVAIDLSALVTLTTLQLRGWAVSAE